MTVVRAFMYSIRRALSGLRRHPLAALTVVGTVAVAFFLVALVHTGGRMVDAATGSWQRAHMVLYLDGRVDEQRATDIRSALLELPAVVRAEHVTSEQAMARFSASLGAREAFMQGIEPGMLPMSIEVELNVGVRDVAALGPMVERLQSVRGVEEVEFAGKWVDDMSVLRAALQRVSGLVLMLVLLCCLYLASTAIASRSGSRVHEAAVARLMGASSLFVRVPLAIEGAIQGAAGAGLAVVGMWLLSQFSGLAAIGSHTVLGAAATEAATMPPTSHIAGFIAAGAAVGIVSTWLATRRHAHA